jgi:hypothetical protein
MFFAGVLYQATLLQLGLTGVFHLLRDLTTRFCSAASIMAEFSFFAAASCRLLTTKDGCGCCVGNKLMFWFEPTWHVWALACTVVAVKMPKK